MSSDCSLIGETLMHRWYDKEAKYVEGLSRKRNKLFVLMLLLDNNDE
jgi:phage terminase large subunit-like protein